jgi:FAD synthase
MEKSMPIQGQLIDRLLEMHTMKRKKEYNQEEIRMQVMIEVEKMNQFKVLEELQAKTQD